MRGSRSPLGRLSYAYYSSSLSFLKQADYPSNFNEKYKFSLNYSSQNITLHLLNYFLFSSFLFFCISNTSNRIQYPMSSACDTSSQEDRAWQWIDLTLREQIESFDQILELEKTPKLDDFVISLRTRLSLPRGELPDRKRAVKYISPRKKEVPPIARELLDQIHSLQRDPDPHTLPISHKYNLLLQIQGSLQNLLLLQPQYASSGATSSPVDSSLNGILGDVDKSVSELCSLHTSMWDDALRHDLPRLITEHTQQGVMATQPLGKDGSTISVQCNRVAVGICHPSLETSACYVQSMTEKFRTVFSSLEKEQDHLRALQERYTTHVGTHVSVEKCDEVRQNLLHVTTTLQNVADLHQQWSDLTTAFEAKSNKIWFDAQHLYAWDADTYGRYEIPKHTRDPATVYEHLVTRRHTDWGQLVRTSETLYGSLLRVAAGYLAPARHVRLGTSYQEPLYWRIAFRFQLRRDSPLSSVPHAISVDLGIDAANDSERFFTSATVEHSERVVDSQGHRYPTELIPPSAFFWMKAGEVPTMVGSAHCVLTHMKALGIPWREAQHEPMLAGGYFVINGSEKILRLLSVPRSNTPLLTQRPGLCKHGDNFSEKAIQFRSKTRSGRVLPTFIHYLRSAEVVVSLPLGRKVQYVPFLLLLCALREVTHAGVFHILSAGITSEITVGRVEALLRHHLAQTYGQVLGALPHTMLLGRLIREAQTQHRRKFGNPLGATTLLPECEPSGAHAPPQHPDVWYGRYVLHRYLFPHLNSEDSFERELLPDPNEDVLARACAERERKFELLVHLLRQLYAFVDDTLPKDNLDLPSHQEVFTLGNLLSGVLESCVLRGLASGARNVAAVCSSPHLTHLRGRDRKTVLLPELSTILRTPLRGVLKPLSRIFTTGSYTPDRSLPTPVPQVMGLSVSCERLNFYRVAELLRGVHRGRHILEMRSTEVRRCRTESWGFYCVVHTPDGEACGVQNHLTLGARVSLSDSTSNGKPVEYDVGDAVQQLLREHLYPTELTPVWQRYEGMTTVMLDGALLGFVSTPSVTSCCEILRGEKRRRGSPLCHIEVVAVSLSATFSVLYLFTTPGRLMRPIQHLPTGDKLHIGVWEQTYLNIASVYADLHDARTEAHTHDYTEPRPSTHLLSLTASVIPFFEHNCSPRNLFQCGITKQSIGPALATTSYRTDTKYYHMASTHRSLVRTSAFETHGVMDHSSVCLNPVLGVMSYSGQDMEDALVLSQSATQSGLFAVYQTLCREVVAAEKVRLGSSNNNNKTEGGGPQITMVFHNLDRFNQCVYPGVRLDGLPETRKVTLDGMAAGRRGEPPVASPPSLDGSATTAPGAARSYSSSSHAGAPVYASHTPVFVIARKIRHSDGSVRYLDHKVFPWSHLGKEESGFVHAAVPTEFDGPDPTKFLLILRLCRPPVVGDKFCSRHGQKGTVGMVMPRVDLPFTETGGMVPDILINPHAFPSRMAVGMMLEMIAGKASAVGGSLTDASPWALTSDKPLSALRLGERLGALGYARAGTEVFYNGMTGEPMEVGLFVGVVGYQRLRHMVADKWQVRGRTDHTTHRVVQRTGQPVHGRKRHGGVRVGEMERDALLSHGAAALVRDRLLYASDHTRAYVCRRCGGMLALQERVSTQLGTWKVCMFCEAQAGTRDALDAAGEGEEGGPGAQPTQEGTIPLIDIPQVLRLLVMELASVGIRTRLYLD